MDYGKLVSIIEDYVTDSSLFDKLIIKSDSLLEINNLFSPRENLSEFEASFLYFLDNIDSNFTIFFFTGFEASNWPTYLPFKFSLYSILLLKWSRNIPSNITYAILVDYNNI